jgi:DNA-binding GntR family transcriptional regulator
VNGRGQPSAPPRRLIVETLADALRSRILSGELAGGTPLREAEVSRRYLASRHTVRAALRLLAAEGLLEIRPHRGASVSRLERHQLRSFFELRAALELEACRLALERNQGRLPPSVHAALAVLTRACAPDTSDWRRVTEAHSGFHRALVHASGSPRIEDAYARLAAELTLFLVQLQPVWPRERMIAHHHELVSELETSGDLTQLRRHLAEGLEAVAADRTAPSA